MQLKKMFRVLAFAVVLLCGTHTIYAQDLLKAKDLGQLRVDQLSEADLIKLKTQLASSGLTIDQVEQMAIAKGMSATEFNKLKLRLLTVGDSKNGNGNSVGKIKSNISKPSVVGRSSNVSDSTLDTYSKSEKTKPLIDPLIFGSQLYTGVAPSFEPNLRLATPLNYILGPDDEIQISVYGVQEFNADLLVSPEGTISIPNVGEIKVAGLSIEAATQKIKTFMGNGPYSYLKSGGSKLSLTLSKIRSIRVTVIGSNNPGGNFTLSSLATAFHALYVAGGPTAFGSFREIELLRNNKLERKIDLYRLLLYGDQSDNIGLKDNDVIRIPAYKKRVELQGQVKRPGIYEILPGEDFSKVLAFASGFTDTAYQESVKVFQHNERERMVHDLDKTQYASYQPQSGDVFYVGRILNRYANRLRISGAVFRPGTYELTPNLRVADLIKKADGLKEDAFTSRGQIIRLQDDLRRSVVAFDIKKALAGDEANNPLLRREDEILINSIFDLRDSLKVVIHGEVRMPGEYDYAEKLTVKDLILQAGGFTDAAYKNVEIARLIKRDSIVAVDNRASELISVDINEDLSSENNVVLRPFDVITVRRKAGYVLPETVIINGEVQYPGPYALSSRTERVSALLKRAGGYTPDSYPEGAYIKRYKTDSEKEQLQEIIKRVEKNTKDSIVVEDIKKDFDRIPLDLKYVLANPGSIADLTLKANDELFVPKFNGEVKVTGAVLLATHVPYEKKSSMMDYINAAGGFSGVAWRKRSYVVHANGKAETTKHFLFFKSYPKILPGSEVIVPSEPIKKPLNTVELIGIASAVASLAGVVIAILQ